MPSSKVVMLDHSSCVVGVRISTGIDDAWADESVTIFSTYGDSVEVSSITVPITPCAEPTFDERIAGLVTDKAKVDTLIALLMEHSAGINNIMSELVKNQKKERQRLADLKKASEGDTSELEE
jgi:hypothetical protein